MNLLRAWLSLVWISFRRLFWSVNTLMVLVPLGGCLLFLLRRRYNLIGLTAAGFDEFSHFLIFGFVSIVIPLCALGLGTAGIGGDREDRTLLFVLVRPLPRALVLLAKFVATLPLALGLVLGSFHLYCWLAGDLGRIAYELYLPAVLYTTLAYLGLFHLFAVAFRHSTIIALVYAVFIEIVLGNLPGIIKRLAVNYYGRSLLFAAGEPEGLRPPDKLFFESVTPLTAQLTLLAFALGGLLLALLVFQRREYRDLV